MPPPFRPNRHPGRQPGLTKLAIDTSPRVVGITPNSDRTAGGVAITITGFNFERDALGNPPTVLLGPTPATSVVVVDKNTITAVAPANDAGVVDVSVTNWHGQTGVLASAFIYIETLILSVSPNNGPVAGGTDVIIAGANFATGSPTVLFDGVPATSIVRIDAQHISCVTPAHVQGPVDVDVNDAVLRGGFFYTTTDPADSIRRNPSLVIHEVINQPSTCSFKQGTDAAPPVAGEEFVFHDDADNLLFAGVVQTVEQVFEGQTDQLAWNVTCTDYTAWLNRRRPFGDYANVSATDIVKDLLAKYAPWVTTNHVQLNLPRLTVSFDGSQDFASCLTTLTQQMGGGYWRLDYVKDLHFIRSILNSSGNDAPSVGVGGGDSLPTAITLAQSAVVNSVPYAEGYYSVRASFVYSNGVEGTPGPWCVPVLMNGVHTFALSNIPTGAPIGGLTVTARRIYYRFFGRRTGVLMAPFVVIANNVDTTLTSFVVSPATFQTPRLPIVATPAAPTSAPSASESTVSALSVISGLFPSLSGRVAYTFEPGTYAFKITHVYDDGTESLGSEASPPVGLTGFNAVSLGTGSLSETVNGHAVVYAKVYASKAVVTGNVPDFSPSTTSFWVVIPGATAQTVNIVPGMQDVALITGAIQRSQPPLASDASVSLEEENPDNITDSSTTLLFSPQISKTVDVTQVRNRVIIYGRGVVEEPSYTTPIADLTPAADDSSAYTNAYAVLAIGIEPYASPARGFPMNAYWHNIIATYGNLNYYGNGVAGSSGELLSLVDWLDDVYGITRQYMAAHPYTVFMGGGATTTFDGVDVNSPGDEAANGNYVEPKVTYPRYQRDNEDSQRYMGEIELDSSGNPTDGIHEVVIRTDFPTAAECIAFADAQLAQFAWPLITVRYATRDPKTHPGRMVSIDLTDPPIHGDFLILNVTIDQIKDQAETTDILEPRRIVTAADPAKFNLDDLLLLIGGSLDESGLLLSGSRPRDLAKAGKNAAAISQAIASPWVTIIKENDEPRSNDTVLDIDEELKFDVVGGLRYKVRGCFYATAPGAADIKFTFSGPALTRFIAYGLGIGNTNALSGPNSPTTYTPAPHTSYPAALAINTSTGEYVVQWFDLIFEPAASGEFGLSWAQNTSNGSPSTVARGSYLEYATY